MKHLKEKMINGLIWNVLTNGINQILIIGTAIFLSRILAPEDFGLLGMVIVFTSFAGLFSELGFGAALIQQKNTSDETYTSVFWLNLGLGILFTLFFVGLAPVLSVFYEEPRLLEITVVISFSFLINALCSVQKNILSKQLAFKKIGKITLASALCSNTMAIVMAATGFGIWALVAKQMSGSIISLLLLWSTTQWKPKLYFEKKLIKNLIGFSLNVTGIKTLRYWAQKVDILVIGKLLGAYSLGLYSRAYFFLFFPANVIKKQVLSVLFPSLSSIQDDPLRVKKMVLKISVVLTYLSYPMIIGLYATSSEAVHIVLGSKWSEIIPLIKILCFAAIIQIPTFPGTIYLAVGRADLQLKVDLISKSVWITSVLIGILQGGLTGATWGVLCGMSFNVIINNYFSGKLIDLSLREILVNLIPGIMAGFSLFLLLFLIDQIMVYSGESMLLSLIIKISSGTVFYVSLLLFFKPAQLEELRFLIIENYRKK